MENNDNENIVQFLEQELFKLRPSEYIKKYITCMNDVYKEKAILKKCYWDYESFEYLLSIFVDNTKRKLKFVKKIRLLQSS